MDPYSPELTGIHIRFAAALEKFGQAKGAVEIMERLVNELVERIQDIDRGRVTSRAGGRPESCGSEIQGPKAESAAELSPEARETERARLLKQVIRCKVKTSQLYESDHIQDDASAKRVIDEAMKILIDSMRDPRSLQFDENRAGISADEAAAMLSQVGESHVVCGSYDTALDAFKFALIALRKATEGKPSCQEAYTLSNMSTAVTMMLKSSSPVIDGKPATEASVKQAHQIKADWAKQSLQCAQSVEPAQQNHLCALAVIASWSNMASTLIELGDLKGAKAMWEQVIQNSESQPTLRQLLPDARGALKEIDEREKCQR